MCWGQLSLGEAAGGPAQSCPQVHCCRAGRHQLLPGAEQAPLAAPGHPQPGLLPAAGRPAAQAPAGDQARWRPGARARAWPSAGRPGSRAGWPAAGCLGQWPGRCLPAPAATRASSALMLALAQVEQARGSTVWTNSLNAWPSSWEERCSTDWTVG